MLKILIVDVETSPKKAYIWRMWKENISPSQLIDDWFMLSWSAKWLGSDIVHGEGLSAQEAMLQDDRRILSKLWNMLDEADVIIAHNGDKFDVPVMNTRFLFNNLLPPSPYKQIDTLRVAKRKFNFSSNRLDYLGEFLGVGRKIDTGGFELWSRCLDGDHDALEAMLTYNKQDVILLEKVYNKLMPYMNIHPNHSVMNTEDKHVCPKCASSNIQRRGYYSTNISTFQRFRCNDCGSWSRARQNVRTKNEMQNTLLPV